MQVPRLTRPILRPLGHKSCHHAAPLEEDFAEGFEQSGFISGRQCIVYFQGRLQNTRSCFGM